MKAFLLLILVLFTFTAKAINYYFSSQLGNDSRTIVEAQNPNTPWKTISKLNGFINLLPGDSVLFKRGDIFFGTLEVFSGLPNKKIVYCAYGIGSNPIFSGLVTLNTWTNTDNGIYWAHLAVPSLNIVTLDGVLRGMGRYPKKGYLPIDSHSANTSITGASIGTLSFNYVGGEVVIRKIRQITDRLIITGQSGNTISMSGNGSQQGTIYANNTQYEVQNGNGFFIQKSLNAVTQYGDWFFDSTNQRLYLHFGSSTPATHIVEVATLQTNVYMDNISNVSFKNIDFEGANRASLGWPVNNTSRITFTDCNWSKQMGVITADNGTSYWNIQRGSMKDVLNSAIIIGNNADNISVDRTVFNNIGMIPGSGVSGDANQLGIWLVGNNLTVINCTLTNIGYHGIVVHGNNTLVSKNLIDGFGSVKDDCGGIYDFQFPGTYSSNQVISNNIVLNGIGARSGAPPYAQYGQAAGIYLDANVNNVQVIGNTIAHGDWGGILCLGSGIGNKITNNLVYDFGNQLHLENYTSLLLRGMTVTHNIFTAKTSVQNTILLRMNANDDPSLFGKFDNNIYGRPVNENATINIIQQFNPYNERKVNLSYWKSNYGLDTASSISHNTINDTSKLRFEYNASDSVKTIFLNGNYMNINGEGYGDTLTISPFTSVVLTEKVIYTVLTLKFLNFSAELFEEYTDLLWRISKEVNLKQFEIERSSNGNSFELVDIIPFKNDNYTYRFKDNKPFEGKTYYRILGKNIDGKFVYSKIILVSAKRIIQLNIFPNPSIHYIDVRFNFPSNYNSSLNLSIKNIQGVEIKNYANIPSARNLVINTSSLAPGLYSLSITGNENITINKQFIKL